MPPYVGEIRLFAGSFAPAGWAFCNGALQPISENDTLFNLIGTTYGGDGQETFALPDLQGRAAVHAGGNSYQLGEKAGVETVTITTQTMPLHTHAPTAVTGGGGGTTNVPGNTTILADGNSTSVNNYLNPYSAANTVQLNNNTVGIVGGSQPHDNIQPTLCISYIISLFGIYPTQN